MKTWLSALIAVSALVVALPARAQPDDDDDFSDFDDDDEFSDFDDDGGTTLDDDDATLDDDDDGDMVDDGGAAATGSGAPASWGIGAIQTPAGFRGAEGEIYVSSLMISGVVGLSLFSPDMGDNFTVFGIGGGAFYPMVERGPVALMVGGRLILGISNGADSSVGVDIEVPLRIQWYIGDHFAFHAETGLVLRVLGDNGDPYDPIAMTGKGFAFGIGPGNLVSTVGGTFYF